MSMSIDENPLNWNQSIPQIEVDVNNLEDDHYGFFQDGKPFTGIAVSYYSNGKIESRRPYLNGMPHGLCQWWYENGQLSKEWTSFRGMGHGWATDWHENGKIAKRRYAEFGQPLEWVTFDEHGHESQRGSNRQNSDALHWVERYRKEFPDAP